MEKIKATLTIYLCIKKKNNFLCRCPEQITAYGMRENNYHSVSTINRHYGAFCDGKADCPMYPILVSGDVIEHYSTVNAVDECINDTCFHQFNNTSNYLKNCNHASEFPSDDSFILHPAKPKYFNRHPHALPHPYLCMDKVSF